VKPARLTPAARQDRRDEVAYYRTEAGAKVAKKLVETLRKSLQSIERQPGLGSPAIGQELGIDGLRAWALSGFPLSLWYFERPDHLLIVRLVGQRQDPDYIAVTDD
jgi:toxin ParE1/3/4